MEEAELRNSTERAFEAYGNPMENVSAFNYLGRVGPTYRERQKLRVQFRYCGK